jgi:hypothetical protein
MEININPELIKGPFHQIIKECSNTVNICIASIELLNKTPEYIVGENQFQLYPPFFGQMNLESSKPFFKNWVVKKGLEDLIKGVSIMMLGLCDICDKYEQITKMTTLDENTVKEVFNAPIRRKIVKLGLPDLIKKVSNYLDGEEKYKDQILSINNARNCLIHRNGFVTKFDDEAELEVRWVKREISHNNGKGILTLDKPTIINLNGSINMKEILQTKTFELGSKVEFTFEELQEIIWTFFRFSEYWCTNLVFEELKIKS